MANKGSGHKMTDYAVKTGKGLASRLRGPVRGNVREIEYTAFREDLLARNPDLTEDDVRARFKKEGMDMVLSAIEGEMRASYAREGLRYDLVAGFGLTLLIVGASWLASQHLGGPEYSGIMNW